MNRLRRALAVIGERQDAHELTFEVSGLRGIRAICACGWEGEWRYWTHDADRDASDHLATLR